MDRPTDLARRSARYPLVFIALAAALCAIVVVNINAGSVPISVDEIARILFSRTGDPTQVSIIWNIRLPRMAMAALLGGALALSGFLLQTFFGNPIAGPFVLGISSGAKMVVALTLIVLLERFELRRVSSFALVAAAFAGSLISTAFILLLSRKLRSMAILLVGGIMIGYICSAITDFLITFASEADIVNLHGWSLGSFSGASWDGVWGAGGIVGVTAALVFLLSKPISAYQLGEQYAKSMGVNVRLFRVALILLSSVLSACVAAFAGPVSFVGIAVPFLIKRGLKTAKPLIVIPATFLGGAVFCLASDMIARTLFAPTELNISTVTSIFGAPIVIFMMLRQRRGQ